MTNIGNQEIIQQTFQEVKQHGFTVLNLENNELKSFLKFSKLFGTLQAHVRANADGVVCEQESIAKEWLNFKNEYKGISTDYFSPHTDGTFLDGIYNLGNKLIQIGPPKLMLLQCLSQGTSGGRNIIIDSHAILLDIIKNRPYLLSVLSSKCLTICRDDQLAMALFYNPIQL